MLSRRSPFFHFSSSFFNRRLSNLYFFMNKERLQFLFEKYFNKTASEDERAELADLVNMESHKETFHQLLTAAWEQYEGDGMVLSQEESDEMLQSILFMPAPSIPVGAGSAAARIRRMPVRFRIAAAAILILLLAGVYRYGVSHRSASAPIKMATVASHDVRPGTYKASLILADGSRITLDSAGAGQLAQQGNTKVISRNGGLLYQQGPGRSESIMYNTLATSKGETYSFSLADGSKIWLNSASSIHFPVSFPGKERRITVTGEVFIAVAKDPSKSFIVSAGGLEITALGTAFNVTAYPDEDHISTTLAEGAVKLAGGREQEELRPGQQALLNASGHLTQPLDVDLDEVIAWKEGNFQFDNADIKAILRQFSRWYDIEVIYEGPVKSGKFFGVVSRNSTLTNVLEMLKTEDTRFRIEGKRLYVSSK
jgi:transmembrane sensor